MNQRVNIADLIADRFTAHTVNLFRFDAGLRKRIVGSLRKRVISDAVDQLIRNDPTAIKRPSYQTERVKALTAKVRTLFRASYRETANAHERELRDLAILEEEFARTTVNRVVGTKVLTVGVPDVKLKDLVKTTLVDGAPSRQWWAGQSERAQQVFSRTVQRGLKQGDSIGEMVNTLRGTAARNFADTAFAPSMREAEALVRSSTMAIANAAHVESFKANDDIVRGVQVMVTWDSRLSETCLALGSANAAWDFEGKPLPESAWRSPKPAGPPFHWNCRSLLTPVLEKVEDLSPEIIGVAKAMRIDALPEEMRRAMNGELSTVATTGADKWLGSQSDAFVNDLLGKTRANLWREGKLPLTRLVDEQARPLTIDQLRQRVKAVTADAVQEARAA